MNPSPQVGAGEGGCAVRDLNPEPADSDFELQLELAA